MRKFHSYIKSSGNTLMRWMFNGLETKVRGTIKSL